MGREVIAFITDYQAVDRIIDHLKFPFVAEHPSFSLVFEQVALLTVDPSLIDIIGRPAI